jgi:NifB/MoaA-like Fe-S oxidoreductase
MLGKRYNGLKILVYPIENRFFGENVTVTGLLTGGDIASQLEGKELGSELLLSRSMFKSGEELFLDDVTLDELRARLGAEITITENEGGDLIEKILGVR